MTDLREQIAEIVREARADDDKWFTEGFYVDRILALFEGERELLFIDPTMLAFIRNSQNRIGPDALRALILHPEADDG